MRTQSKKTCTVICLVLMLVLAFTMTTGCTIVAPQVGQQETTASGTVKPAETTAAPTTAATTKAAVDEGPFKMTILTRYFGSEYPDVESDVFKEIQKATNTEIEYEFVPDASYNDKFDVKLASRQLAMLNTIKNIKAPNVVNAAENGAFWVACDYINESEFPYLAKTRKTTFEATKVAGKNYFIMNEADMGRPALLYRQDLAEKHGITEKPKTIDELYALIQALDKDCDFGLTLSEVKAPTDQWPEFSRIAVWFGAPNGFGIENGKMVYAPTTEGWKKALDFVKKLYDEGLINTDFAAITDKVARDSFMAGRAGAIFLAAGNIPAYEAEVQKIDPNAKVAGIGPLDGGKGLRAITGTGTDTGYGISKDAVKDEKSLKKVLKYLNDTVEPVLCGKVRFGTIGEFYLWVEEGKTVENRADRDKDLFNKTVGALGYTRLAIKSVPSIPDFVNDPRVLALQDESTKYGVLDASFPYTSDTLSKIGPQLNEIIVDATVKYIFGELDMAGYEKEIERWYSIGGTKVLEEFQAQYDKANK